ncbi:MAG: MATE family efflux transporter [Clostridia bacterium]|nr:MATE family efflux transporter [Clostridia bacterium]
MGESKNSVKKLSLVAITWPIFIETLLRMFLGNVDTFMLSHYSDNAVGAVGIANQVNFMLMLIYAVSSTGILITISQYLGANQRKKAVEAANTALLLNFIFGFILSGGIVIFAKPLLRLINTPVELMDYASTYLRIVGSVSFIQALLTTTAAIIRSFGKTKVSMYVTMGMNIVNVIGNSLFLYGFFGLPVLGVTGVAISTAVSQTLAFFLVFFVIMKKIDIKTSFKSLFSFRKDLAKQIIAIGLPSAAESGAYQVSQLVITAMINTMGAIAVSTKIYTMNILWFVMLFGISLGQGTQIIVGHHVGARENDRAYKACLRSLKVSLVIAAIMSTVIAVFGKTLVSILTSNEDIIQMAGKLLWYSILLELGRVFNLVVVNALKASGDATFPAVAGIISPWFTSVLFCYLLGIKMNWGLVGVWIGLMSDEWLRGVIALYRWKTRIWESKRLVTEQKALV